MRVRIIVLVTAVLLFSAVMAVPRIIEASKSSPGDNAQLNSVVDPFQGKKQEVTVGESIRNDTSIPVREMKQQPVFKPKKEANANPKIAHFHKDAHDPVVQKSVGGETDVSLPNMPGTSQNFNGMAFPGV